MPELASLTSWREEERANRRKWRERAQAANEAAETVD